MSTFYLKELDTSPTLEATLRDSSDNPVDLTDATVEIRVAEPRGGANIVQDTTVVNDPANGEISYTFSSTETEEHGRYRLSFRVDFPGSGVESFPNKGYHTLMIGRNLE